jgi:hypothetical protein
MNNFCPRLEILEARDVPTVIVVQQIADNIYQFTKDGKAAGKVMGPGLTVTGTLLADTITINFTTGLMGNLNINPGNGNDTVTINGSTSVTSLIQGSIPYNGGYGDDTFSIGVGSKIAVTGTTNVVGNLGYNTFVAGGAGSNVTLRAVTLSDISSVTVGNNVLVEQTLKNTGSFSYANNFLLDTGGTITILDYSASALADTVTIKGTIAGNPQPNKYGAIINVGYGDDSVTIEKSTKSVYIEGGDGFDTVTILDGVVFNGDLYIDLVDTVDDPGNSYNFGTSSGAGVTVAGNLSILNTVAGTYGNSAVQNIEYYGKVGGNMNVQLGDGDNTFTFKGVVSGKFSMANFTSDTNTFGGAGTGAGNVTANITATNFKFTIGRFDTVLTYGIRLGTGANSLNFLGGSPYNFLLYNNLLVGFGANTLTYPGGSVWQNQNGMPVNPLLFF